MKVKINTNYVEYLISKRNRTKRWFASRCNVSEVYVNLWLTHQRNPGPESRKRIVSVLRGPGVTWSKLFIFQCDGTTGTITEIK